MNEPQSMTLDEMREHLIESFSVAGALFSALRESV
jgi:hypothetical protein